MSSFTVQTPALAAAAAQIASTSTGLSDASSSARSLAGEAGAFGGEEIASAFTTMASQAQRATEQIETVMESLSRNVAAAAVGYLVTDQGVVPTKALPGFKA